MYAAPPPLSSSSQTQHTPTLDCPDSSPPSPQPVPADFPPRSRASQVRAATLVSERSPATSASDPAAGEPPPRAGALSLRLTVRRIKTVTPSDCCSLNRYVSLLRPSLSRGLKRHHRATERAVACADGHPTRVGKLRSGLVPCLDHHFQPHFQCGKSTGDKRAKKGLAWWGRSEAFRL